MNRGIDSVSDARLIGKTPAAVKGMIEKGKLPVLGLSQADKTCIDELIIKYMGSFILNI